MFRLIVDYANKLSCNYSIFITFRYKVEYVEFIKSLPIRSYNQSKKEWEIPYESYEQLIGFLNYNNIPYNVDGFMQSIESLKEKIENNKKKKESFQYKGNLEDEEFKLKPRDYQMDGIRYGLSHDNFLLADQQGLGKSLQLTNIARFKKGGQHCLIIVGYDSLQFNWVNEIEKYCNEKAYVIGQRELKSGKNKGNIRKGNTKERIEDLLNLKDNDAFFIITSVATLRTTEKTKYIDKNGKEKTAYEFVIADIIENLCKEGVIGRIVFDEAQVVKSIDAIQTKALLRIKSANYKVLATGTPIMNKHIDLYPLMLWLGYENGNYFSFRNNYCVMGGFKNKQIVGNKNGDELNKRLETFMLRRKKEDVLDLPEKIIIDEVLEMDLKQAVLYDKIQKMAKSNLAKMKGNKSALLAMLIKLRQITCHPKWVDDKFQDSVKFERVHQLLHEINENNQKVIIFSNWATPIEWLYDELNIYNPAMITGSTKDRMSEVKKFQEDDSCRVIVGTGGAMGTGLTLTAASNVIFIDEPWNRALKDQWTDRAHRIGTKNNVNIYTLLCKGTVDEMVHKTVQRKGMLADNVIDGISLEELEKYFENFN